MALVFLFFFNLVGVSLAEELELSEEAEKEQVQEDKQEQGETETDEKKEEEEKEAEPEIKKEDKKEEPVVLKTVLLAEEDDDTTCTEANRNGLEKVRLNEILPDPSADDLVKKKEVERIELYNSGSGEVDIGGCCLVDGRYKPEKNNSKQKCFFIKKNEKISSGEYKVFERTEFVFDMNKSDETVFLLDEEGKELDKIFYKSSESDFSFALNSDGNWQWVVPTFGLINVFPVPKIYSKKIEITEFLPNPKGVDGGKEWVELLSSDIENIKLDGWHFLVKSNQSDSGKKQFELDGLEISSGQRLKVEITKKSSFLRNSKGQVSLVDPNGEIVDVISYEESAKENSSYNKDFNGEWSWSIFITPGKENRFNSLPTYKVDIPDEIYEDVKVEFKIKKAKDKDGENLKYRWEFGDGKKSYLQETSHTFTKKGGYTIRTRVSDLSADVFKYFKITVKKFPKLDLRIVKILPNPEGSDSDNEKIWIENEEKRTVNLKGWVVATGGSMDSLVNHYIKDDFKIKAGKIKILNRNDCPFSLLNKKGRVVLKSPNGEVVDKVKYEKEKIAEDELYYLENNIWVWETPVVLEIENPEVLGETALNQIEAASDEQPLFVVKKLLDNPYFNRTNRLKLLFFENWLFAQSQGYFFEFLFPESMRKRTEGQIIVKN